MPLAKTQSTQNNLCDPFVLGTTSDPNFVTFVLFVVTNCLTTKDAKYTKEEIQGRNDSPCGIALQANNSTSVETIFHGASRKDAKFAKVREKA